ncbi:hypothetical protein [Streptomyces sp. AP-93]|uniref:hypothetical protein n=1 Tax=Streptomyces sp. AP-93 TaxID=2929048 RepID=UPI001FAFF29C|nr:hypothetical protein [Streptomyces sp. AP-93]MCJ0868112.1 hypothetical protein [Streptomyces sp. AP-93]
MKHTFALVDPWPDYGREDGHLPEGFASLAVSPPAGCTYDAEVWGRYPGLRCEIEAPTRFEAVALVVGDVYREHGVFLHDLGVEKLYEWNGDDPGDPAESGELGNTWGRDIAAQLLLMGIDRVLKLGYSEDDVERFVRTALGRGESS